ncbi:hypothetical protein J1N35_014467 [Gossypium stocksii]|uniref:Cytochrome f n=1 Tax=Gossypium stocksii TaxID=47602 RepID=A0A9D3VWJ9_9ROSI|nr:hypothetical protein J1N35_014467 [Gossypium stocksii]
MIYIITEASISNAYPIFAQQGYENPREAIGRIVCANCHLANKPVDIEVETGEGARFIPTRTKVTILFIMLRQQGDAEIVLQDPLRIQGLLFLLASIVFAKIFLVLKKKQFEKVQVSEMNF